MQKYPFCLALSIMNIKAENIDRVVKAYSKYPEKFKSEVYKTMIIYGNKMEDKARGDHKYSRKSGNLDNSIKAVVDKSKMFMKFWIDPNRVTVRSKSGTYNYGVIQHEGSYSKYTPSGIAPKHPRKNAKNGGGVKHDYFMLRAWNKYIDKLKSALAKDMLKTTVRLGM